MRVIRAVIRLSALGLVIAASLVAPGGKAQSSSGTFEPVGLQAERGYFSQFGWESIDMTSGNLVISHMDMTIPGNAGMSLGVLRTMNYGAAGGPAWSVSLAGVPIAIEGMVQPPSGTWTVGVIGGDGGKRQLAHQAGVDTYLFDNFMRLTLSTRTLEMPNGMIATYEMTAGVTQAQLVEVHDAFGNSIGADWLPRAPGQTTATKVSALHLVAAGNPVRTIAFTYDASGTEVQTISFQGRTWTYAWSGGRIVSATPPAGPAWQYVYSTDQMSVVTPLGGVATYNFDNLTDPQGHAHPAVTSRGLGGRDIPGGVWYFSYNRSADPVVGTVQTPDGRTLEYKHQPIPNGTGGTYWNVVEKTLRRGANVVARVARTFQGCGDGFAPMPQTVEVTQDGRTYTTTLQYRSVYENYCDFHRPSQVTQVGDLTRTVSNTYLYLAGKHRGDLVESTSVNSAGATATTEFTVDSDGFVTRTRVQGIDTHFAPGPGGNVASVTDANGQTTSFTYQWGVLKDAATPMFTATRVIDASGLVESETRRGITTTYTYDLAGRPTGVTAPLVDAVTLLYNSDSVTTVQGPSWVDVHLDGFGRETQTMNAAGVSVQTQYDADGRVVLQTYAKDASATGHATYTYDDLGRVTSVTQSGGGVETISRTGSSVTTTDANGRATTQHLALFGPGDGRVTSVVDPAGKTWQYQYNGFGSLTQVTQPGGSTRTFGYNALNRLTSETHPESGTTTFTYDDVGNLISKTDARGWVVQYGYDANHRLTAVNTLAADSVVMSYDASDNRTSVSNGTAASTFAYDNANQLTSRTDVIGGKTFVTTYGYDGRGNLRTITYPTGRVVSYDVDVANRITKVFDSTGQTYADNLSFHPSGAIAGLTFGNGQTETTTFDARYRPQQRVSGPLNVTYGYDPAGNVTSITDARAGFSSSFTYDVLDRLRVTTGWGANEYTYDDLGNRTWEANGNVTSSYAANLRLSQTSGTPGTSAFGYDAVGNVTGEATNTFTYTPFNLMRTAKVNGVESAYGYDGDQQRVVRTDAQGTTYSIRGPGGQVLAEYEDAGMSAQLVREYIYLGGRLLASVGRPAAATPPTASIALTSPANGTVALAGAPVTFSAQAYLTTSTVGYVAFYLNGVWIASDLTAPYSVDLSTVPAGTHRVQAMVVGNSGPYATSAVVTLTVVAPNVPPTVSLTAPLTGTALGTGRSVTLTATASDANGIQKVEFYKGSLLLATDTTAPYSFDWTDLETGAYTLTAKAYDTLGLATVSAPANITVSPIASVAVSPASPTAGASALVTVDGAAFCSLVTVDFGDGQSQMVHHAPGLPLSVSHTWATAGAKTLTATGHGASCDYQATKAITVLTPPSVSVTAPTAGATFNAPATIAITASASAAQGTIAAVDFFANGSLLHTDTTAPFAFSWTGVPVGSYGLTARATDTQGAVATSSSVNVIVGTPPPSTVLGVSVTPAIAGQAATVTATGTNPCGMIWMDFGDGDWFIIPISGLPFQWNKVWTTPGTYTVLAKGFHDCYGEVTTQVTVTAAPPADDVAGGGTTGTTGTTHFAATSWVAGSEASFAPEPRARFTPELPASFTPELQAPFTPEHLEPLTPWTSPSPHAPIHPSVDEPGSGDGPDLDSTIVQSTIVLVNISGTGSGTVTGTLPCAGTNERCVGYFEPGQAITLTATPAAGSVFTGWTGVCATSGTTCAFGAVHGALVVANFRATFTAETVYYHLDPLGSVRAVTSAAGAVLERHDYRPFGEDNMPLPAPGADPSRFLGQQRDQTKLDQFGARYYTMFTGRFTGVDPLINPGAVASPQRWNRYAYALNNPLRYTDTTGLDADGGELEVPIPPCMGCPDADAWMAERDALWWETWHKWRAEELERQRSAGGLTQQQIIAQLPPGTADATQLALAQSEAPVLVGFGPFGVPLWLPGGFRESGFQVYADAEGAVLLASAPGHFQLPTAVGQQYRYSQQPDASRIPTHLATRELVLVGSLHVHPGGALPGVGFDQRPSGCDRGEDDCQFRGNYGLVLGARDRRVYFYTQGRNLGSMSLRDFLRAVR